MDWAAAVLLICGNLLLGSKRLIVLGFGVNLVGGILWTIYAVTSNTYSLLMLNGVYSAITFRNFLKWHRRRRDNK